MAKIKFTHVYILFILSIIICFCIYSANGQEKYDKKILALKRSEINGRIVKLKEGNRGSTLIVLADKNSNALLKYTLPISWDIEHYHIEVGESIRKKPHSSSIHFYKFTKGKSLEICEFHLSN